MSQVIYFLYEKITGEVAVYELRHAKVKIRSNISYIAGISESNRYMTLRADKVIQRFDSEDQANKALEIGGCNKALVLDDLEVSEDENSSLDVCFTGFSKSEKQTLVDLAINTGLTVRKSVTAGLQMLCCGANAGYSKLEKAGKVGAIVLDQVQFCNFIETGEVPSMSC